MFFSVILFFQFQKGNVRSFVAPSPTWISCWIGKWCKSYAKALAVLNLMGQLQWFPNAPHPPFPVNILVFPSYLCLFPGFIQMFLMSAPSSRGRCATYSPACVSQTTAKGWRAVTVNKQMYSSSLRPQSPATSNNRSQPETAFSQATEACSSIKGLHEKRKIYLYMFKKRR